MRKGNRELIKEINRNLVLNLIKDQGPISRTDLARLSGLSPASVSGITADLMAINIVQETGEGESSGGRRPVLLRLNAQAGYVVGLKLMENAISIALTDLDARVLNHAVFYGDPLEVQSLSVETILGRIIDAVEKTIADSQVEWEQVLGIGIGMAGSIDGENGICRYSPFFKWRHEPIAQPLADHFGLPVYVENDVNTLTIAEKWFGFGYDAQHFIVVTVGRGIGAGIITNGQFYRGALGSAGEFGHIPIGSVDGRVVTLESVASDPAVLGQVRKLIAQRQPTILAGDDTLTMAAVTAAADAGDALAQQVLAEAGRWLGIGIATLINILSPERIIVGGEGVQAGEWRLAPMCAAIKEFAFDGLADQLEIVVEPSGDETWARGAATLVLGEIFKSPVHKKESEKAFM